LKQVYILLSRTKTIPSRVVHAIDGGKYSHVSIATTLDTDSFYSYARRDEHNFLIGGLVKESTRKGVFSHYPECFCALYSLEVDDKTYKKLCRLLNEYLKRYDLCKYSFFAILPMMFGYKRDLKYKMTCSQFVALLLYKSGAAKLPKHPSLMKPNDFLHIPNIKLLYNGTLGLCLFLKGKL